MNLSHAPSIAVDHAISPSEDQKLKLRPFLVAALLLPACLLPATTTGGYNITTLNFPNSISTSPAGINGAGQVVGSYQDSTGTHGFLYQNGAFTTINCTNSQVTIALAINDSGIIYGACGSNIFEYVISSGQLTTSPIQLPPGYSTPSSATITAISPTGEVFGYVTSASARSSVFEFLLPNGPASFVAGIPLAEVYPPEYTNANSSGEIVFNANGAFQSLDGVVSLIPQLSTVTGVGPLGQLLGVINSPDEVPVVYQDGLITFLQLPSATGYVPTPIAINASGTVVGHFNTLATYYPSGFLATPVTPPATEQSVIHIDSPNPTSGTLFGSRQLSGWAINNNSGIDDINILVDGAFIGTTTTTLSRPDVCAAYPNQSGCPTVGWQYMLDTTQLADGTHTLETVAISNTGQRAKTTASITVANAGQTASLLKLVIDAPTPQSPVSGKVTVSGWAEDPGSYVSYVAVTFDLAVTTLFQGNTATRGISRPDVCAAFPGDLNCPNVGWNYTLNSTYFTNGPHTMTVVATAANGDQATVTKTFTIANSGALNLYLDQPTVNSGTLSGKTPISGWAFDPNSHISSVIAYTDGLQYTYMNFGSSRPDVCAAMPGGLDCPNVGWSGTLYTPDLANGTHTLSIAAFAQNGDLLYGQPISFVVNNPSSGNTTHAYIDTPSVANQQFWADATFSGWALDTASTIDSLDFLIDGNVVPAGGYSITGRPDVCVAFPNSPNCPGVGWKYTVNTFALSNGTHTLTLIAVSLTGSRATASATFTVNNDVGQNGTKLNIDSPTTGAAPLSGTTNISGWALSTYNYIASVNASIDAGPAPLVTYHLNRPDVCQAYPDVLDCPNVGWSFGLDTTQLTNGVHRLNVTASQDNPYTSMGITSLPGATQSVFFTVANSITSSPIASYIDTPTTATPALSGITSFSGWSIDQTATIANVAITVDGIPFGFATYGASRPDVCAGFPQYAGCPAGAVGWSFAIDTTILANGSHTLAVTSASADGKYNTITSSFTTAN